ncbi:MAG: prolipoprotein diacylglyceryl transferase, partial [Oscillospiraceae bacterium]
MINNITFPNLGIDITVNRVAFSVFGMEVYWYGIIIATGLILGFIYAIHEAKRTQLSQDDLLNMFLIAIPVAIICARLYFVAFSWDMYKDDLWSIFDLRSGGIAVYGSLIGAGISVLMYCYIKKINLGMVLDIMAIGFLIGQAVGRWGNFVNGEAFGCVTNLPWGMSIKADGIDIAKMVHPTFLYESRWN